jgi:hypothetical protein
MKKDLIFPTLTAFIGGIAVVIVQEFLESKITAQMKEVISYLSLAILSIGVIWLLWQLYKHWINDKIVRMNRDANENAYIRIAQLEHEQQTLRSLMVNMNHERLEENRVLLYVVKHRTQDLITDINSINLSGLQKNDHFIMDMKMRFEVEKFHINNSKISQRVQDTITNELYKE